MRSGQILFTSLGKGRAVLLAVSLFLLLFQVAWAGAWVQKKGGYYVKVSSSYVQTSKEFDFNGTQKTLFEDLEIYQNPTYQEFKVETYFEYGLTNRLTAVAILPFKVATDNRTIVGVAYRDNERISNTSTGFADLQLQARLGVVAQPVVLSLQPVIKIPLGYNTSKDNEAPALGTGNVDYGGWLLLGKGFYPLPLYVTGGVGYTVRTGLLHDEIGYDFEVGLTFSRVNFKGEIQGVQNTTTPPDIYGETVITPLPGGGGEVPIRLFGDQNFTKFIGEVMYKFHPNLALSGQVFHMLAGKNIVSGTTFSVGFVLLR